MLQKNLYEVCCTIYYFSSAGYERLVSCNACSERIVFYNIRAPKNWFFAASLLQKAGILRCTLEKTGVFCNMPFKNLGVLQHELQETGFLRQCFIKNWFSCSEKLVFCYAYLKKLLFCHTYSKKLVFKSTFSGGSKKKPKLRDVENKLDGFH